MVINRFKQYFRKITFFGLIAWCVAIQATTGIFKDLSTYNHAYTPQIERFKKLANHGQKLLPNLTDLSAQQKTLLAKHLQTIQTTTLGHININQLTNNAKTMINIPLMSLLQFAPWLLYHNFVLCSEIKRTYEADKTYWDAELKKPKPKDPATVSLIKQLKPKDFLYYSPTINKSGTLTEQILINFYVDEQKQIIQNHYMDMYSDSIAEMIHTFFIEQILQTAIETEKKFKAQGYETFFHARRWNWHFVNDICNLITNIFYPEQYHANKHMLRFRSPHEDIATLYQYRKQLVEHGVIGNVDSTFGIKGADGEATCMNRTILSNMQYFGQGECTGEYLLMNHSIASIGSEENMLEQLIYEYELESYFTKYSTEFKKLITLHKKINQYGELLCIAIKKEYISEMVYASKPFDIKCPDSLDYYMNQDLTAFSDTKHLEDICRFYCFAVSDIPGEYNNKYVIESICTGDKSLYAQYCAQRDALFAKIKTEYLNDHQ